MVLSSSLLVNNWGQGWSQDNNRIVYSHLFTKLYRQRVPNWCLTFCFPDLLLARSRIKAKLDWECRVLSQNWKWPNQRTNPKCTSWGHFVWYTFTLCWFCRITTAFQLRLLCLFWVNIIIFDGKHTWKNEFPIRTSVTLPQQGRRTKYSANVLPRALRRCLILKYFCVRLVSKVNPLHRMVYSFHSC